jgi:hypothetical protein
MGGVQDAIRTEHLPNRNPEHYYTTMRFRWDCCIGACSTVAMQRSQEGTRVAW